MGVFRDRAGWYYGVSAYWFATSAKWFILLLVTLPSQVKDIVPGGDKNTYWGLVFAIGAAWAIIGPSVFGHLSDRLGSRKPYLSIGAALTVIAMMVLWQAPSIAVLAVGYLLLQVADDVGTGPYSALIADEVPEERRGRASGVMGLMSMFGPLFIGVYAFLVHADVAMIYIGLAVLNVVCALWTIAALKGEEPRPPRRTEPFLRSFIRAWIEPWKSRDFFWVWFTRFLFSLGFYLVQPYLQYYLQDVVKTFSFFGLFTLKDAPMATNVIALTIFLFGAIGSMVATRISDRVGRKKVIYIAGTLIALVLVPFIVVPKFEVIFLLSCVFGVGYGMYYSADWALATDVLPDKDTAGSQMGVWQMSTSSVQIVAGSAGRAIDALNKSTLGLGYQVAFATAALAFFVSTVLVRQVRGSR